MNHKTLYLLLFISSLVGLYFFVSTPIKSHRKANQVFFESTYRGKVLKIGDLGGERGCTDIQLEDTLIVLCSDKNAVKYYLKLGDSILKKEQSNIITVYRENASKEWTPEEFAF